MNNNSLDGQNRLDKSASAEAEVRHQGKALPLTEVPVFNCLVYVSPNAGGGVRARVGNLAGIEFSADTERGALGQIVAAFKKRVGELTQSGVPIPWIEPPMPTEAGEQKRFIPVHL